MLYIFNTQYELQKKIFPTKLKGHPNLFVTGEFLYSQYRNKEENTEGIEGLDATPSEEKSHKTSLFPAFTRD